MPTARNVINTALRRLQVLGAGESATDQEYADYLPVLSGMYRNWINAGLAGRLPDVVVYDEHVATPGTHILRMGQFAKEILLPEVVSYDARIAHEYGYQMCAASNPNPSDQNTTTSGGARYEVITPHDLAVIAISDQTSGKTARFMYDGQNKLWCPIDDIGLDYDVPFADRDPDGFIACLQFLLADENGKEPSQMCMILKRNFMSALANKSSSMDRIVPSTFL